MNPVFLFGKKMTPLRKLLLMKAVAGGVPLNEYTATGNPVTFETNVAKPLKQLLIPFTPVQEGSGDPSPENVRPITGWTGLNVTRTGKNLIDATVSNGDISSLGGYTGNNNTRLITKSFIRLGAGTYYFSNKQEFPCAIYAYASASEDSFISSESKASWNNSPVSFTLTNARYVRFKWKNASGTVVTPSELTEIMLNLGESAFSYVPYTGQSYNITFPAEARTVYGGTLDLTTGVLTVDTGYIASYNGETLPGEWLSDRDVYSAGTIPTTGAQVAYELGTPVTYQLTSQQITALMGDNTIWSDTNGNNTAVYLKRG